jgi:hypothetical protein
MSICSRVITIYRRPSVNFFAVPRWVFASSSNRVASSDESLLIFIGVLDMVIKSRGAPCGREVKMVRSQWGVSERRTIPVTRR